MMSAVNGVVMDWHVQDAGLRIERTALPVGTADRAGQLDRAHDGRPLRLPGSTAA